MNNRIVVFKEQTYFLSQEANQKENENQVLREQSTLLQSEIDRLGSEKKALTKTNSELEERLTSQQQSEFELYNKTKEIHALVNQSRTAQRKKTLPLYTLIKKQLKQLESAKLERDQAISHDETKTKEISRLSEKIKKLNKELKYKVDEETKAIEEKHKLQILSLQEDIKRLENQNSNLSSQLERAIRDKKYVDQPLLSTYPFLTRIFFKKQTNKRLGLPRARQKEL